MPENRALSGLCSGIIEAYDLFGVPSAVVLFVVEEVSYNICDQRFHEFEIFEKRPDIMVSNVNYFDSVCVCVFFSSLTLLYPEYRLFSALFVRTPDKVLQQSSGGTLFCF